MQYQNTKCFKTIFFTFIPMVIGSSKAWADLPLPMVNSPSSCFETMTEMREFLVTSDSIVLLGFLLWAAYIMFFFPKGTLKKL